MGWLVAAWLLGMLGLVMAGETKLSRSEWVILLAWPVAVPAAQVIVWWRRRHPQPFRRSRTDKPNAVLADAAPESLAEYEDRVARKYVAQVTKPATPDTATPGEAKKRHLHSCFPSDCDHIANRCCIDCCEPGGWAEPAASSVDDKEGDLQ